MFRAACQQAGIAAQTDSAGTSDWHVGAPPYGPMTDCAAARGIDISDLRARQFTAADFSNFDLLIAMDRANQTAMETLRPAGNTTPITLFLDYAPDTGATQVPDPYYTRDFDTALSLIQAASAGLLATLH